MKILFMTRIPLVDLLGKIASEIFIAQFIIFASIALIWIFIYHMMKKPPEIIYKTIEIESKAPNKAITNESKPTTIEILYVDPNVTSYPNVQITKYLQKSNKYSTVNEFKESIDNQINELEQTDIKGNPTLKRYVDGSKDMAINIKEQLDLIEKPLWSIWIEDINVVLDDLDLTDSITPNDLNELYQLAQSELYIDDQTVSISIQNFVRESLSYINPEKYELFQIDTTIEIKYDLEIGNKYNGVEFVTNMNQYKGRIANINSIHRSDNDNTTYYHIDIDHDEHKWTRDMFNVL